MTRKTDWKLARKEMIGAYRIPKPNLDAERTSSDNAGDALDDAGAA